MFNPYYFGTPTVQVSAAALNNSAEQVFSAAVNVNGAWVISATFSTITTAANVKPTINMQWGAAAPTGTANKNPIFGVMYFATQQGAVNVEADGQLSIPYFVPAGNGVWWFDSANEAGTNWRSASYRLL